MKIISDFALNLNSIEEFARVMVPEALTETFRIKGLETEETIRVTAEIGEKRKMFSYRNLGNLVEEQKAKMVKILLLQLYEKKYSWGSLMGVRPSKLVRRFLDKGGSLEEIKDIFQNFYLVSQEKLELLIQVVLREKELLNDKAMNLYIGIPFCPTKCTYCSFASYEITSGVGRYYQAFLETLRKEIQIVGEYLKKRKFPIESIYIGGGTPSILEEKDLEQLLSVVGDHIERSSLREYTFEGGREDTLNQKKIKILQKYGVSRLSLNPQTFREATLRKINRQFNQDNFDEIYWLSKNTDLLINMDIIIGLPEEKTEDILYTLERLNQYDMDNLTIHSLALKRHARLFRESEERIFLDKEMISRKIMELIASKNMNPYYLYRQKNLIEWGENVGYATEGSESLFNMEMIEENQITVGLGGGAITKIITKDQNSRDLITRYINPKDPALYIREMETRTGEKLKALDAITI